jgi:hypothetical protein
MGAGAVDRTAFAAWLAGYERSWRSTGTAHLRDLFTEDASYRHSPFAEPLVGIDAIARDWEREREGPDEVFTMTAEIIAVDGDTGVAKVSVRYGEPAHQEYLDLWIVRFAADGRCVAYEEWPFWPDQSWRPN